MLLLGLWNKSVSSSVFDHALRLRERLTRQIAVSTHNLPHAAEIATSNSEVDVLHVGYNAVRPKAEPDIFPKLPAPEVRPGHRHFTAIC